MSNGNFEKRDSNTYFGCENAYVIKAEGPKTIGKGDNATTVTTVTVVSASRKDNTLDAFVDFQVYGGQAADCALLQKGDLFTAKGHEELYKKKDGSTGIRVNVQGRVSWASRLSIRDRRGGAAAEETSPAADEINPFDSI